MDRFDEVPYKAHTEQPAKLPGSNLPTDLQNQVAFGGIAVVTIFAITFLIREIRLLTEARKP